MSKLGMYDFSKNATIELHFNFLSEALTSQGMQEGYLDFNEFFEIKEATVNPDTNSVVFECDVFQYLGH